MNGLPQNLLNNNTPILLYDGVCNFCNASVQFVFQHEKYQLIYFASLQSEVGQALLEKFQLPKDYIDSLVYIEGDKVFLSSDAAIQISKFLKFPYSLLGIFWIVPRFIRDTVYKFIAKNRYKWFGKSESCMLPTAAQKSRFLG